MRYLWYSMYAFVTALAIYSLFFSPGRRQQQPVPAESPSPLAEQNPLPGIPSGDVQVALILDTSSSMDGLIEQARTQLWEIVAELQTDENDQDQVVSVALYQYGNNRLAKEDGFIEKLSDLTPELDGVSIKLHSLSTSGGSEHAPEAIRRAVQELAWSDDDDVEKVIVIAGNEGFAQGPINSETALSEAANKGIKVIPIFCANGGATSAGLESWKRAAQLAGTDLDTIDPDKVVAKIETPYDSVIVQKYKELEATELTYGDAGYQQQIAQHKGTAASYSENGSLAVQADRAVAQSRQAGSADLTRDYGKKVSLDALAPSSVPSALQGLSKEQQVAEIKARQVKRAQLESEIKTLSQKRKVHLNEIPSYAAKSGERSLGSSVRQKLRGQ